MIYYKKKKKKKLETLENLSIVKFTVNSKICLQNLYSHNMWNVGNVYFTIRSVCARDKEIKIPIEITLKTNECVNILLFSRGKNGLFNKITIELFE